MPALRTPSARPELLTSTIPAATADPFSSAPQVPVTQQSQVGMGIPPVFSQAFFATPTGKPSVWLGRGFVVSALPLSDGPKQLLTPLAVHDEGFGYLADPAGNLVGFPGLWVHRILTATVTEDTRRL